MRHLVRLRALICILDSGDVLGVAGVCPTLSSIRAKCSSSSSLIISNFFQSVFYFAYIPYMGMNYWR